MDVVADGQITAYPIDHIEVTVNGSGYSVEGTVPETDVQVVAYYYGSDRTQLSSMPLSSSEFYIESVTATDDPAQGEVVVGTALTGNNVETTVPVSLKVVPAGDIAKIEVTWAGILPKLDYAEMPEISADDVTILAYDKDNKPVQAPAASDVKLSFVDGKTHLALNSYALKSDTVSVAVKAEYGELAPAYDDVAAVAVTLAVQPVNGFALTIGDKLGTPEAEDFLVDLYNANDNSFIERLAGDDVVLTYVGTDSKEISKDFEVASGSQIAIKAEYLGAEGKSTSYLPVVAAPKTDKVEITAVKLNADYDFPAKQYYNNIAAVVADPSAIESITYTYIPAEGDVKADQVLEYADFANTVAVEYSTTNDKVTALADEDDLTGADAKLYLHVTYTFAEGVTAESYKEVTLATAEETAIELTAEYATKYGTTPLTGSAVKYTVTTSNSLGDVQRDVVLTSEKHNGFGILVNNANATSFPSVGEKSQTVRVYLTDNKKVESNIVTIEEGTAFVADSEVASLTVEFNETGKAKKLFVDDVISQVYTTTDFVVKYTPNGTSDSVEVPAGLVKIVDIDIATSEIATTTSTSLTVDFEYLADDGTMTPASDTVTIAPISWVEISNLQLVWADDKTPVTAANLTAGSYDVSEFAVIGYTKHGTEDVELTITKQNVTGEVTSAFQLGLGEWIQFDYTYAGRNGEVGPSRLLRIDAAASPATT